MKKCLFCFLLTLVGTCQVIWAKSERAVEQPAAKTRVPIGADRLDPALEDAREAAQTARMQWSSVMREHLVQVQATAGRILSPAEMALAEAAFIRENFEDYVAMETLQQEHREKLSIWARVHEHYVPGEDQVLSDEEARDSTLNAEERVEMQALRKASLRLLTLEAQSAGEMLLETEN